MDKIALAFATMALALSTWWGESVARYEPPKTFIAPPESLHLFSFGYQENMSDALWIRVIQDFDVCEQSTREILPPRYFLEDKNTPSRCHNAWVSQMLKAITFLTPKFMAPYRNGATMLSVLVDDREGAKEIFDRGLKEFPNDWTLNYRAAYHYMFEMLDEKRAAELLMRAGQLGAPQWVFASAANLLAKNGQREFAIATLKEAIEQNPEKWIKDQLEKRLKAIEDSAEGKQ